MKVRLGLIALASGALALGMLMPAAVNAAPSAVKPSGKAMVRIDGGTAYAKEKSTGTYRIIVPDGAEIDWMGEVTGQGVRTGTFTPRALVAGWVKMGHRDGTKATTTLTWVAKGDTDATFQTAYLSKPRINSDGQLTFIASTLAKAPLPRQMKDFSINVAIAADAPRSFTVFGQNVYFDAAQTTFVFANATAYNTGSVWFGYLTQSPPCTTYLFPVAGTAKTNINTSFVCGPSFTVNSTMTDGSQSYLQMAPPAANSASSTVGSINAAFSVTPKNGNAFDISRTLMNYTKGGGGSGGSYPS